jgi:antibiotic biosynthesis monooxygenase (ABM) superfamily enzyme
MTKSLSSAATLDAGTLAAATPEAEPVARVLSRPRFALLIFAGVYPLVTCLLYAMQMVIADWALWQRTLLLVPLVVLTIIWGIIPFLHWRFSAFMHPPR